MTKLLATTSLLVTLLVSPLMAKERKGYFDCRIMQSYTVQFTDGVSKEYHGSMHGEIGPNVGESIKVEYSIVPNIEPPKISVQSYSVLFFFGISAPLFKATEFPKDVKNSEKTLLGADHYGALSYISEDFFNLTSVLYSFRLFRHFKNDWQGIVEQKYTDNGGRNMHTTTLALDCRHTKDILDELFAELKGMGF